jgi:nitrate reductase cytochrome c-type subunit
MHNGQCPECHSTEVYASLGDSAGIGDEHVVSLIVNDMSLVVDTYVCLACGHVRQFVSQDYLQRAVTQIPKDEDWRKVS